MEVVDWNLVSPERRATVVHGMNQAAINRILEDIKTSEYLQKHGVTPGHGQQLLSAIAGVVETLSADVHPEALLTVVASYSYAMFSVMNQAGAIATAAKAEAEKATRQ